jgi:hypothetical protein
VGDRPVGGDDVGEDLGSDGGAQPVMRGVGLAGIDNGGVDGTQVGAGPSQQGRGPLGQHAADTAPVVVKAVLGSALGASSQRWYAGAVRARSGVDAGRADQSALLVAAFAGPSPGERGPVTRLAHRPLGPTSARRANFAAVGAQRRRSG